LLLINNNQLLLIVINYCEVKQYQLSIQSTRARVAGVVLLTWLLWTLLLS